MPASTPTQEPAEVRVRRRLRELRQERGLTITEVAGRAGMAVSTLSRLEGGGRRLALDHLPALARALGVTADELIGAAPLVDPRVRSKPIMRDGIELWPLSAGDGSTGGLRAFRMRFPAGRRVPEPRVHEGHEWLYVVKGRLRLVLGEQDLVLEPGEAAEFSTLTEHWMGAVEEPVEALAIFGPQGERVHVRT